MVEWDELVYLNGIWSGYQKIGLLLKFSTPADDIAIFVKDLEIAILTETYLEADLKFEKTQLCDRGSQRSNLDNENYILLYQKSS